MKLLIAVVLASVAFAVSACQSGRWICGTCAGYGQMPRPLTTLESATTTANSRLSAVPIGPLPLPQHPWELARAGIPGTVDVRITVGESGRVSDAAIIASSMKDFEAPVLAAVESWRFLVIRFPGQKASEVATLDCRIQFGFDES